MRITTVDSFTHRKFTGNPAAVCILAEPPEEWWMRDVAREMNLSETAFLLGHEEGYDLRWFTPAAEVDLCGHATLAAAHVLWEEGHLAPGQAARFHTRSGELRAEKKDDWIELDVPSEAPTPIDTPDGLAEALGAEILSVHQNRMDLLVEVEGEKTLRTLAPDFAKLRAFPVRGVVVTCEALADRFDFASRWFGPRVGVDEDPVTGSAHCALAPFWGARLGKEEMVGYQVSARGGVVRTRLAGDRVVLGGQAVTVMRGELV